MISLVEKSLPPTDSHSTLAGRLRAWWEAYGNHPRLAHFYSGEQGSCAAVLDTQAILLCHTKEAREEFASFFALQSGVKTLYTDTATAAFFSLPFSVHTVMRCEKEAKTTLLNQASPREIYELLTSVFTDFPAFEPWYLDVSYRMRHNLCHQSSVWQKGKLVASAMTVAEWQNGALLGAVATLPEHRRKGYASHCVSALTAYCQQEGKVVYISPKNQKAGRLYASLGFADYETVAYIERM